MRRKVVQERIDIGFRDSMKNAAKIRIAKGLAKPIPKEISLSEMTRLLKNTEGFQISMEELETKPKRK